MVLASKPSSPATPDIPEISTGAFVLPNAIISDDVPLSNFIMPGKIYILLIIMLVNTMLTRHIVEAVERAAGLTLFSEALKRSSKHICQTSKCELMVRRFDDAQKKPDMKRAISAPR